MDKIKKEKLTAQEQKLKKFKEKKGIQTIEKSKTDDKNIYKRTESGV